MLMPLSGSWISTAEVAEIPFTAFAAEKKAAQVFGRLPRRINPGRGNVSGEGQPRSARPERPEATSGDLHLANGGGPE
jgi:hypothetical protein